MVRMYTWQANLSLLLLAKMFDGQQNGRTDGNEGLGFREQNLPTNKALNK